MNSAQKVKWTRTKLGLNQKQFAHLLNVTPAAVCRWENGNLMPEGGNRQLIDILYIRAKVREENELAQIGKKLFKPIRFGSPIGCLNMLLDALINENQEF